LGVRPQAALILCEWDRENLLRQFPTATWEGTAWDNRRWVGPWLDEAAALLRENAQHVEITLHGVGHEYWEDGQPSRAEWYDEQGEMRPRNRVLAHLDAYARLMAQNDLGPFPTSFVPAAFRYTFGDGEAGLAAILAEWGVQFISTPFATMHRRREPETPWFGFEQGIMTVDRGRTPRIPWYELESEPAALEGPILGLHWPNILHRDPRRNDEIVERWVRRLRDHDARFGQMLAPDTMACAAQLRYHAGTDIRIAGKEIICDTSRMTAWPDIGPGPFVLAVKADKGATFTARGGPVTARWQEAGGYHVLTIRPEARVEAVVVTCHTGGV
jgi:hypothetical protein